MEEVVAPSISIAENYFNDKLEFKDTELNDEGFFMGDVDKYEHEWKKIKCEVCNITLSGDKEYEGHLKSKRHNKILNKEKNHQRNMEMKRKYELIR